MPASATHGYAPAIRDSGRWLNLQHACHERIHQGGCCHRCYYWPDPRCPSGGMQRRIPIRSDSIHRVACANWCLYRGQVHRSTTSVALSRTHVCMNPLVEQTRFANPAAVRNELPIDAGSLLCRFGASGPRAIWSADGFITMHWHRTCHYSRPERTHTRDHDRL